VHIKPVKFLYFPAEHVPSCSSFANRLSPAGPPDGHAEVLCRSRRQDNNNKNIRQRRRKAKANGWVNLTLCRYN
jgi:hypothetical protein